MRLDGSLLGVLLSLLALHAAVIPLPTSAGAGESDGASAVQAAEAPSGFRFRRAQSPRGASPEGLTAVAARGGLVAVGDADGVALSVRGGPWERVVRSGRVRDLRFAPDGSLWVSAADGLHQLSPTGRVARRSPGTGELARLATRLCTAPGLYAAATAGGLFLSRDGRAWSSRVAGLPGAPVVALALRSEGSGDAELLAVAGGFAWHVEVADDDAAGIRVRSVRRLSIGGRPAGVAPVEVAFGLPGADWLVAYPQRLAVRSEGRDWRWIRPVLPPGASIRRIVHAAGRVWLVTSRGLLEALRIGDRFVRSASPAGTTPASGLTPTPDGVLVSTAKGLLEGSPRRSLRLAPQVEAVPPTRAAQLASLREPDIHSIQLAALRYLELGPERFRELRTSLDRRGWLPLMSLRVDYGADRDARHDWDQSFVSGDTRKLYDYVRVRNRDLEATVQLTWDLGDTVYNPDAIELSRESRQRISLRDDALDEINQLYFERRSVLVAIDALAVDADPIELARLRLRAQELAAGLDGWTGGWFTGAAARMAR